MSQLCRFQPLTYPFGILCHVFAVIVGVWTPEVRSCLLCWKHVRSAAVCFGTMSSGVTRASERRNGAFRWTISQPALVWRGWSGSREREDPQGVEEKTGSEKRRRRRTRERSERLRQRIQSDQTSRCSSRTDAVNFAAPWLAGGPPPSA